MIDRKRSPIFGRERLSRLDGMRATLTYFFLRAHRRREQPEVIGDFIGAAAVKPAG